jgi:hypothetical protein
MGKGNISYVCVCVWCVVCVRKTRGKSLLLFVQLVFEVRVCMCERAMVYFADHSIHSSSSGYPATYFFCILFLRSFGFFPEWSACVLFFFNQSSLFAFYPTSVSS